jgi:hypothetical protein
MLECRRRDSSQCTHHLLGNHDYSLDGELPVAVVEQVLQTGTEQIDDQNVVQAFLTEVVDIRDPGYDMSVQSVHVLGNEFVVRQPCAPVRQRCH